MTDPATVCLEYTVALGLNASPEDSQKLCSCPAAEGHTKVGDKMHPETKMGMPKGFKVRAAP